VERLAAEHVQDMVKDAQNARTARRARRARKRR
jgi:hypothetical protein